MSAKSRGAGSVEAHGASMPGLRTSYGTAGERWVELLCELLRSGALGNAVSTFGAVLAGALAAEARAPGVLAKGTMARGRRGAKYRSDQLLVTVATDVARPRGTRARPAAAADVVESVGGPFAALQDEGLVEEVTAIGATAPPAPSERRALSALRASVATGVDASLAGVNLVRLAPGASLDEVSRRLDGAPGVREIERVPIRTIALRQRPRAVATSARVAKAGVPWNLRAIGWKKRTAPSAASIKVAVLDSGVDTSHPDLDIQNYEHGDASAEDIIGHGTHVCGIIAGKRSRNRAFHSGICNAELHVWKIFGDEPDPDEDDYVVDEVLYQRALAGALKSGCKIVNLSIGGEATTSAERTLIKRLVEGGVSVVAAMGNEYAEGNPTEYPAALPGVIAVGAVREDLSRAPFSNTGAHIALVAPGTNITSTLPLEPSADREETRYAAWDGTSMAAPHVAAAVARLLGASPSLTPEEVKSELQQLAVDVPAMGSRTWTRTLGAGLLKI